ncbi:hypothetical protein AMTR_s00074p00151240 [Amborella trichopoda]|uniref:Phosphofructokinase domain-containing protein n=1 Tax=Amborella trichopoda TaxID=13333 RepID=W1NN08_AMBTC|nr:hypothetical protein AMTR_s00074p00151240 [Amborella trichopoda]
MNSPTQWFQLLTNPLPSLCLPLTFAMLRSIAHCISSHPLFTTTQYPIALSDSCMNLKVGVAHLRITFSVVVIAFNKQWGVTLFIFRLFVESHRNLALLPINVVAPSLVLQEEVYIRGGDGTQTGASVIYKEIERRGLKVSVAGIPKTVDNDIAVIDKSFGFDTAVEEAQRAINAAHVEAGRIDNGLGIVNLMGHYCGFIAMYATLASRDVDCCLIPESPFYLEREGGLFDFIEKQLKENGHMVIVLVEGAGQELVAKSMRAVDQTDASGIQLLLDVGLWHAQNVKHYLFVHCSSISKSWACKLL